MTTQSPPSVRSAVYRFADAVDGLRSATALCRPSQVLLWGLLLDHLTEDLKSLRLLAEASDSE